MIPKVMADERARLIGLDWGTSSVRAYLMGDSGTVLARKAQPWGVMSAAGSDFAEAYRTIVGGWRAADPTLPALASGMIGSTEGWVNAPYRACPAGLRELGAGLVALDTGGDGILHVVPGLETRGDLPGVMRGEETQVAGALALRPELGERSTVLLPGTHAKWVDVNAGRVTGFSTYMTGELFAVLRDHSILGRPARRAAAGGPPSMVVAWEAFERGVRAAQHHGSGGLGPVLFLTRSLVLAQELRAEDSLDFLSGLLIGDELRCALGAASANLALVGEAALCERYVRALRLFGISGTPLIAEAGPAGLWRIAVESGLILAPATHV